MRRYRVVFAGCLCVYFGGIFLLHAAGFDALFHRVLVHLGVAALPRPFGDAQGILAAAECYRAGFDVALVNPCDMLGRPWTYSPLWFDSIPGWLTPTHTTGFALALDGVFLVAVASVLRPASRFDVACSVLAATSADVLLAVERANADVVIFSLCALGVAWLGGRFAWRAAAYAVFWFAGALKDYPFALVSLIVRERSARRIAAAATFIAAAGGLFAFYRTGILAGLAAMPPPTPQAYAGDAFGAANLSGRLAPAIDAMLGGGVDVWAAVIGGGAIATAALVARRAFRLFRGERRAEGLDVIDWSSHEGRCLLVGAVVMAACFFSGLNNGYRGIHLLFVLPGLLAMRRRIPDRVRLRLVNTAIGALILVLWQQVPGHALQAGIFEGHLPGWTAATPEAAFWIMRELLWWWLAAVLVAIAVTGLAARAEKHVPATFPGV